MQNIICILAFLAIGSINVTGQSKQDSLQPKVTFKGLFQSRFIFSLKKEVDVNGLHHTDGKGVNNTFDIRRARAQFSARISDRTEAVLLLNLADFKTNPQNKVLENAFLTYRLNSYINFRVGQFRPAFGLEDTYPIDIIKSFDYSNQYNAFSNNGWQSFQIGLSMYGGLKSVPLKYELTVINGNNRNQPSDDDNGKQATLRLQLEPVKNYKIGVNGGYGKHHKQNIYAAGIDASVIIPLKEKLSLELETEWKQGNNHALFFSLDTSLRIGNVNRYIMHGFYILPNLRYAIEHRRLSSIELSCRYESLELNYKNAPNARQTITPMLGLEFLKAYNARIQIGIVADIYRKNIPASTQYNNQLFIVQVQSRL